MTQSAQFQGFFSYSHHDATTDPTVIEALKKKLEQRVNSKLVNASFTIWRDKDNLRIGNIWHRELVSAIQKSDIFVVIISPQWISSDFCRKEYLLFADKDISGQENNIAPLVFRSCEGQQRHFNAEQTKIYNDINCREYLQLVDSNFIVGSNAKRTRTLEKIADDIVSMIEKYRVEKSSTEEIGEYSGLRSLSNVKVRPEFDLRAHNFARVDFISDAEISIKISHDQNISDVFAFVEFLDRLYIENNEARIEFGIRRAILHIEDKGQNCLSRIEDFSLTYKNARGNAYYIKSLTSQNAVVISIDPLPGSSTLKQLPLPPAIGENRFAKVASVNHDVDIEDLEAKISVSLCTEGLFVFAKEGTDKPSPAMAEKIAAIIHTLILKNAKTENGQIIRKIPISKRKS